MINKILSTFGILGFLTFLVISILYLMLIMAGVQATLDIVGLYSWLATAISVILVFVFYPGWIVSFLAVYGLTVGLGYHWALSTLIVFPGIIFIFLSASVMGIGAVSDLLRRSIKPNPQS